MNIFKPDIIILDHISIISEDTFLKRTEIRRRTIFRKTKIINIVKKKPSI